MQDFREVDDGPFDAICSIGMFEHVGRRSMENYTRTLHRLLRPGGRFLNHAIGRPTSTRPTRRRHGQAGSPAELGVAAGLRRPSQIRSRFIDRYVFPDGELHEVGTLVSTFQAFGFEVRHLESLREHYGVTLRRWVSNLEHNFEEAVKEVGAERARVWRLYMAGSACGFDRHHLEVHQVLCVRPDRGRSLMPLRPTFEPVVAGGWPPATASKTLTKKE